jgi:hypothetical protein
MVAMVIILVTLTVFFLALYAIRSKVRLKVSATALKLFSFNIEVNSAEENGDLKQLPASSGTVGQSEGGEKGPRPRRVRRFRGADVG